MKQLEKYSLIIFLSLAVAYYLVITSIESGIWGTFCDTNMIQSITSPNGSYHISHKRSFCTDDSHHEILYLQKSGENSMRTLLKQPIPKSENRPPLDIKVTWPNNWTLVIQYPTNIKPEIYPYGPEDISITLEPY